MMGIDTYLAVAFWVGIVGVAAKLFCISLSEYPRREKTSLGADLVSLIVSISFFVWVCFLRFGGQA